MGREAQERRGERDGAASGPQGEPGRSAQTTYERRRRSREHRARRRLGRLGVIAVRLSREPRHLAAWRKGAAGERRLARRLHGLLDNRDVRLLHDRRLRGSPANIDHIAIGPAGVTVIDAKNLSGAVRVERYGLFPRRERLRVAGRDRTVFVDKLERQVGAVAQALAAADLGDVPVAGALCVIDAQRLPLFGRLRVRGVRIGAPRTIAELAARPGELGGAEVDAARNVLAARFPEA